MKGSIIGIGLIIAILGFIGIDNNGVANMKNNVSDSGIVNCELVGNYIIDTTTICRTLNIKEGTPFTWFLSFPKVQTIKHAFKDWFSMDDVDIPDIEYDDEEHYLVVSFGREIKELHYHYLWGPYKPKTVAQAEVTFFEEYKEQTMYVYLTDEIFLTGGLLGDNIFYIMQGDERVYWGREIKDLNEKQQGTDGLQPVDLKN